MVRVGTPDSVQVLTNYEGGACGSYRLSGVIWHDSRMGIAMISVAAIAAHRVLRYERVMVNASNQVDDESDGSAL